MGYWDSGLYGDQIRLRNRSEQERVRQLDLNDQQQAARDVFAREVPQADQLYNDLNAGRYSAALAQQRAAMGQNVGAMQMAQSGGNPLAARGGMFAAAQQGNQMVGQYAGERQREVMGAQQQAFQARLRQMAYADQLRKMQEEYERNVQNAHQGLAVTAMGARAREAGNAKDIVSGIIGAGSAAYGMAGQMPSEGGGGGQQYPHYGPEGQYNSYDAFDAGA